MKKRTAEWFEEKLYNFFIGKYVDCEGAEFYIPPQKNQYVFDFPDRKQRIILTCSEDGRIEEKVLQYTSADLIKSSEKIQRAEAKSLDYSDMLKKVGKSGNCLPIGITTRFYETIQEEESERTLRKSQNALRHWP